MESFVKGAIIAHLKNDGFPTLAEDISEVVSVQASESQNEVDLSKSLLKVLEEGLYICFLFSSSILFLL